MLPVLLTHQSHSTRAERQSHACMRHHMIGTLQQLPSMADVLLAHSYAWRSRANYRTAWERLPWKTDPRNTETSPSFSPKKRLHKWHGYGFTVDKSRLFPCRYSQLLWRQSKAAACARAASGLCAQLATRARLMEQLCTTDLRYSLSVRQRLKMQLKVRKGTLHERHQRSSVLGAQRQGLLI
jgi:hypothetical protein